MSDPKDNPNKHSGAEDELSAKVNDPQDSPGKHVDSFKTGNKKQGLYHDQPFDEQMYDPDTSSTEEDARDPET